MLVVIAILFPLTSVLLSEQIFIPVTHNIITKQDAGKEEPLTKHDRHSAEPSEQQNLKSPKLEQTPEVVQVSSSPSPTPNEAATDTLKFDGDCAKYSRQLLSQAALNTQETNRVKGQVEMFKQTIHLTAKPSFADPSNYEASALDVMNRRHNGGAESRVSAEDAVEKALVEVCENLRRDGFDSA